MDVLTKVDGQELETLIQDKMPFIKTMNDPADIVRKLRPYDTVI